MKSMIVINEGSLKKRKQDNDKHLLAQYPLSVEIAPFVALANERLDPFLLDHRERLARL